MRNGNPYYSIRVALQHKLSIINTFLSVISYRTFLTYIYAYCYIIYSMYVLTYKYIQIYTHKEAYVSLNKKVTNKIPSKKKVIRTNLGRDYKNSIFIWRSKIILFYGWQMYEVHLSIWLNVYNYSNYNSGICTELYQRFLLGSEVHHHRVGNLVPYRHLLV